MKNLEFQELSNKEALEINGGGIAGVDCPVIIAAVALTTIAMGVSYYAGKAYYYATH
ncbi:hypothetical protein [Aquimarina aggregata]|uniref:hypothetical protein n=1 Tax=Aquimarina aggregata TaxID=1642818 RepID=UPI000ADCCA0D|nr:hypothetical protein [Aquimarina aggregata]